MSDRPGSMEVEDVLSSIRRLVSDDLRPSPYGTAPAVKPEGAPLILTPALRITPAAGDPDVAADPGFVPVLSGPAPLERPPVDPQLEAGRFMAAWQADSTWTPEAETTEAVAAWQAETAGDPVAWPADPHLSCTGPAPDPAEVEAEMEAALREIVRDMIRDELQGDLGQRITRNIRKVLRAEIARALALRELR